MTSAYYRGAVGAIVAFDVTKVSTVLFKYRLIACYRICRISFTFILTLFLVQNIPKIGFMVGTTSTIHTRQYCHLHRHRLI